MQTRPEWQAATEALLLVVEHNGPTMLARIGIPRPLNAGKAQAAPVPRKPAVKAYWLIR